MPPPARAPRLTREDWPRITAPTLLIWGEQDVALQKARETVIERSHLRLWLAPFDCEGLPVWLGQASRDVAIRFTATSRTFGQVTGTRTNMRQLQLGLKLAF